MVSRNIWYTQCSGDDSSPSNVPNTTRGGKTEPPPDMSFRGSVSESRNLPELQVLPCSGSFSNVVDSSTPLRCGRNDNFGAFLRIRPLFLQHFTPPRWPSSGSPRRASFPRGTLLYRALGWCHSTTRVVFATWRAASSRENYGVIATGNLFILVRCAEHHPYMHIGE